MTRRRTRSASSLRRSMRIGRRRGSGSCLPPRRAWPRIAFTTTRTTPSSTLMCWSSVRQSGGAFGIVLTQRTATLISRRGLTLRRRPSTTCCRPWLRGRSGRAGSSSPARSCGALPSCAKGRPRVATLGGHRRPIVHAPRVVAGGGWTVAGDLGQRWTEVRQLHIPKPSGDGHRRLGIVSIMWRLGTKLIVRHLKDWIASWAINLLA